MNANESSIVTSNARNCNGDDRDDLDFT